MLLALSQVVVRRGGRVILGPLDWSVAPGERWVVLGANGSGKTTLVSVASMSLWPTAGTVEVLGERYGRVDARTLRSRIGLASTAVEAVMRPDLAPAQLIVTARHGALEPWWHEYTASDHARAAELGAALGLADRLQQPFETLSAGERRRVSIARALMPDPDLLVLDEPMANLDLGAREGLIRDLARLAGSVRPAGLVLVTHHLEDIPAGFEHALVLRAGQVVQAGPIEAVLADAVLSEAFGLALRVGREDGRWTARVR